MISDDCTLEASGDNSWTYMTFGIEILVGEGKRRKKEKTIKNLTRNWGPFRNAVTKSFLPISLLLFLKKNYFVLNEVIVTYCLALELTPTPVIFFFKTSATCL